MSWPHLPSPSLPPPALLCLPACGIQRQAVFVQGEGQIFPEQAQNWVACLDHGGRWLSGFKKDPLGQSSFLHFFQSSLPDFFPLSQYWSGFWKVGHTPQTSWTALMDPGRVFGCILRAPSFWGDSVFPWDSREVWSLGHSNKIIHHPEKISH